MASTVFGFAGTVIILALDMGRTVALAVALSAVAVIVGAALTLRMYHRQPDIAPDFLASLSSAKYAEVEGFCFHLIPVVVEGELFVDVHYQNRFDQPCNGRLRFQPMGWFIRGIAEFETPFNCGAGEYGVTRINWPLAGKCGGKRRRFLIRAELKYPLGRGNALRFRSAFPVRSGRTSVWVTIPKGFRERSSSRPPENRVLWTLGQAQAMGFPVMDVAERTAGE